MKHETVFCKFKGAEQRGSQFPCLKLESFRWLLLSECAPYWPKPRIQCVILSFYTATTMDRSLLRLTPHLAEARGGQAPLVADAFNTACPKNYN